MSEALGKVTIAPDVLVSIARLTTLATPGVAHLSSTGMRALLGGKESGGVRVTVENDQVTVDVRIVVEHDANMLQLSQNLQAKIARAIQKMVGMDVSAVNIYIEDVEFPPSEE
jgi:uncharacterized alkaline shock family protein YloU